MRCELREGRGVWFSELMQAPNMQCASSGIHILTPSFAAAHPMDYLTRLMVLL